MTTNNPTSVQETSPATAPITYIDVLRVRAGKRSGVYLEGEVKAQRVYMPLTVESARQIAYDLTASADAAEAFAAAQPGAKGLKKK